MKDLIIVGAGGLGRKVFVCLRRLNTDGRWNIRGFIDDNEHALDGKKWMYIPSTAADCCEDTAAVEAFDATFPPKEKKWMPSQEEFYIYSHSSVIR